MEEKILESLFHVDLKNPIIKFSLLFYVKYNFKLLEMIQLQSV